MCRIRKQKWERVCSQMTQYHRHRYQGTLEGPNDGRRCRKCVKNVFVAERLGQRRHRWEKAQSPAEGSGSPSSALLSGRPQVPRAPGDLLHVVAASKTRSAFQRSGKIPHPVSLYASASITAAGGGLCLPLLPARRCSGCSKCKREQKESGSFYRIKEFSVCFGRTFQRGRFVPSTQFGFPSHLLQLLACAVDSFPPAQEIF